MHRLQQSHALGIISFLSGFGLMAYELVAARILAPTIGSSTYVWTSVIGIIITALSLGYWLGGKVADRRQKITDIALLCIISAFCVAMTILLYPTTLASIATSVSDVRVQGVLASLLLFAPTSFFLGCLSPYLAKLNIKTLQTAGESVANLSALNSIGGIIGTFITGFVLFSYLGSKETLIIVIVCLLFSSWLIKPRFFMWRRISISIFIVAVAFTPLARAAATIAVIDTPSAHYTVSEFDFEGESVYGLSTGPGGIQSAVYTDGRDDLVFWYTNYAKQLIEETDSKTILVLGGGTFTLPAALVSSIPDATIDVVEIDPELETIAKEYFYYQHNPAINLHFADARAFVNTAQDSYDAIFVDVYGDSSVPFSLLTQEYGAQIQKLLNPQGIVIVNAIVGTTGECRDLLGAIDAVYRPSLPNAFWQTESQSPLVRGNHILLYTKESTPPTPMNILSRTTPSPVYTDNLMPAERIQDTCRQAVR